MNIYTKKKKTMKTPDMPRRKAGLDHLTKKWVPEIRTEKSMFSEDGAGESCMGRVIQWMKIKQLHEESY